MNKLKLTATILATTVLLTSCGFWSSLPDHLSNLEWENTNLVVSVNSTAVGNKNIDSMVNYAIADNNRYSKKDYDVAKEAYANYLQWKEYGGSYALKVNLPKILASMNWSNSTNLDEIGASSYWINLWNKTLVWITEDIYWGFMSAAKWNEITSDEEKKMEELTKQFVTLNKDKTKDSFEKAVTLVDDNSDTIWKMLFKQQKEGQTYDKYKEAFGSIKFDWSNIFGKLDPTDSLKGNAIDSKNFKNFSDAVDLDDTYVYMVFLNSQDIIGSLQEMLPENLDSNTINSMFPSEISSVVAPFKDKLNNILKFVKNIQYAGIVISKDWDDVSAKLNISSTEAKEFDSFQNSIKLLIDTGLEKFKTESLNNLSSSSNDKLTSDEKDEIKKNINSISSKLERNGDDVVISITGKIGSDLISKLLDKETEKITTEFDKK